MRNTHDPERRRSKLARRSTSLALTAGVIVAVLLLNVLFSTLAGSGLWFIDLTTYARTKTVTNADGERVKVPEYYELYTLTDGAIELLDTSFADVIAERAQKGEDEVKVELIFCEDPDNLMSTTASRYVYLTALSLQKQFPDIISVRCIDVYKNPSAVQKYKTNSFATVYPSNIIVSSGSEYRRLSLNTFFTFSDSSSTEPWAYNGEKTFCSAILSVIKAEAPVACLITNHGESGYSNAFLSLLDDAGYEVITDFDLLHDDIPEDCRLLVCVAPTSDFAGYLEVSAGSAEQSEIAKLDAFLDDENSLMVFFNADTPVLPNFEEYLEKWGMVISRETDSAGDATNYLIKDPIGALTSDGQTFVADYVTTGLGASVTSDMQAQSYPAKVIFRNATALEFSSAYKTMYVVDDSDGNALENPYTYGSYSTDGVYRQVFDVFTTPAGCVAWAGNRALNDTDDGSVYKLMTIAKETVTSAGDRNGYTTVSHDSYVVAIASTDFLADELLSTNAYGNTDMLAGLLRTLGVDPMSALVDQYIKPFVETDVESDLISAATKKNTTIVLCLLPAVVMFGSGIYVMTKRKHS